MRRLFISVACPMLLAIGGVLGPSIARADGLPAGLFLIRQDLVSTTGSTLTSGSVDRLTAVRTLTHHGTSMLRTRGLTFDRAALILRLSGTQCHAALTTALMDRQRQRLQLPLGRWQRSALSLRPSTVAHTLGVSFAAPGRGCRLQLAGAQLHVVPKARVTKSPMRQTIYPPHPIALGAAVRWSAVSSLTGYANTFLSKFQWMTAEDAMKMTYLEPAQNVYNFSTADLMIAWAQANGKQIHGHTLIWHEQLPGWITQGQPGLLGLTHQPWTAPALQQAMDSYIANVVGHFNGKVPEWDVVNEPLHWDGTLHQDIWSQTIGPDYIEEAYRDARAADPTAKLCLNQNGAEAPGPEADALYALISRLRAEGLVDCLGFEMHLSGSGIDTATLEATFRRFAGLGVEIHISEMDDDLAQVPGDETTRLATQAQAYHTAAIACYRVPQCTRFTTWGVSDAATWLTDADAEPLPFDPNMAPKPAWAAIQQGLQSGT
jgi:endo-1,4-beta-xylanase